MPTLGEHKKISKLVADLLSRPSNSERTAEELADEIAEMAISSYEEMRAKTHNMIVLGHFRLDDDDTSYVAAVGPLSTKAVASARAIGERFAWDWRTKRGHGRYVLVPLVRDPNAAWDAARAEQVRAITDHLDLDHVEGEGNTYYATGSSPYQRTPACVCGTRAVRAGALVCVRHENPERETDGGDRAGRADGSDRQKRDAEAGG